MGGRHVEQRQRRGPHQAARHAHRHPDTPRMAVKPNTEPLSRRERAATPTPIREDLLVRVLGGLYVPVPQLLEKVQRRRALHALQLAAYQEKEAELLALPAPPLQERYRHLTLRRGILYEQ